MGSIGAMTEREDANRYFQEDVASDKFVPEGLKEEFLIKVLL